MDSHQGDTFPAAPPSSSVAPEGAASPTATSAAQLLELSQVDLYQLFRRSRAGAVPTGRGHGTPIFFPGTFAAMLAAKVFGALVWRGKAFNPESADLKNLVTPLSIPAIRARVYRAESWFDGAECVVLDYSETSRICGWIRDEIREARPGLYLGLVYGRGRLFGGRRLLDVTFVLDFSGAG
jgi:hypothetical protein